MPSMMSFRARRSRAIERRGKRLAAPLHLLRGSRLSGVKFPSPRRRPLAVARRRMLLQHGVSATLRFDLSQKSKRGF